MRALRAEEDPRPRSRYIRLTIPSEDGLPRRTIVKGAAWTVPVVAIAMATPASAASTTTCLVLKPTDCTKSGNSHVDQTQASIGAHGTKAQAFVV
ncbi:hypothetical protein ACVLV4_002262 [Rathayibacter agropyri]